MSKPFLAAITAAGLLLGGAAQATQFVTNGNFATTSAPGTSFGFGSYFGGAPTITGWSTVAGYNFLFATYTQAINAPSSITSNPGYNNNTGLYLWSTTNGGNTGTGTTAWSAPPGATSFIAMDADYNTAAVTQTIGGLQVGKVYTLSFDYAFAQQAGFSGNLPITLAAALATSALTTTSGATCSESTNLISGSFSGWGIDTCNFTATASTEVLSFLSSSTIAQPPFALFTNVSVTQAVPEPMSLTILSAGAGGLFLARRRRARRAATR